MIDNELAHKIVDELRGKEIRPSDVLEAILMYEYRLNLENTINGCRKSSKVFKNRISKLKRQKKVLKEEIATLESNLESTEQALDWELYGQYDL